MPGLAPTDATPLGEWLRGQSKALVKDLDRSGSIALLMPRLRLPLLPGFEPEN